MRPIRKARIASLIKEEISVILQGELKDPRIGFVSVLGTEPTVDLKECKVFVSILGSESEQRTSLRGLEAARGRIQALLRSRVRLRETPILRFVLDESYQKTQDIEEKIRLAREEDEASARERESRDQPTTDQEES